MLNKLLKIKQMKKVVLLGLVSLMSTIGCKKEEIVVDSNNNMLLCESAGKTTVEGTPCPWPFETSPPTFISHSGNFLPYTYLDQDGTNKTALRLANYPYCEGSCFMLTVDPGVTPGVTISGTKVRLSYEVLREFFDNINNYGLNGSWIPGWNPDLTDVPPGTVFGEGNFTCPTCPNANSTVYNEIFAKSASGIQQLNFTSNYLEINKSEGEWMVIRFAFLDHSGNVFSGNFTLNIL